MRHRLTIEDIENIIKLYQQNVSTLELSKLYKITKVGLKYHLKKYKVYDLKQEKFKNREKAKKCYNETAFDTITEESAYWIGFLMADGWVTDANRIGLSLKKDDIEHIEKFKKFVDSENKISFRDQMCEIRFRSKIISEKLIEYGVIPRKSLAAKVSDNLAFNRDFWRGMVDGDGSIGINKNNLPIFSLVGSEDILKQFKIFLKNSSIDHNYYGIKNKNHFQMVVSGRKTIAIINLLYDDSNTYLNRKYTIYEEINKKFINKTILYKNNKGENNPSTSLKNEDIRVIRELRKTHTVKDISKLYNICFSTIYGIINFKNWREI